MSEKLHHSLLLVRPKFDRIYQLRLKELAVDKTIIKKENKQAKMKWL